MKKIVILNYRLGEVIIGEYDTTLYDAEEYITSVLNLNLVEIEYISGNDLTIKGNNLTIKL
jgi:hypothetical protein